MSARLLADENIDDETCGFLRGMGHSVTHVRGMKGHPRDKGPDDEDVLACAAADQRAVITDNVKHFKTLHDQGQRHFGIIGCPAHIDPKRKAEAIDQAVREATARHGTLLRQFIRVRIKPRRPRRRNRRRRRKD